MCILYGSRTGSGSITDKEDQEKNKERQEHVESPRESQRTRSQTERGSTEGLGPGANHDNSAQTQEADVKIEYKDAKIELNFDYFEWVIIGFIIATILLILDYQGYY